MAAMRAARAGKAAPPVKANAPGAAAVAVATVAAAAPANLTLLLWVNGRYESSGGQALPAVTVDWAALARAAGLRHVATVGDAAGLRAAFTAAHRAGGPAVIVVEIAFDSAEQIPPYSERPDEIRARFRL